MKKIIALLMIFVNLVCISASAETTWLNDEQKSELYDFGIMVGDENGDLKLDAAITRAEAVKIICSAGGIEPKLPDDTTALFPDVPEKHWAYKYIYAAKENGIVAGDENGYFNPNKEVTNEEMVKMIVCLLGYGVVAEQRGGYPAGYTLVASQTGITSGMLLEVKTSAIRNDVGIMVCNALDIPILEEKYENPKSDNSTAYEIGETTLKNKLKSKKITD